MRRSRVSTLLVAALVATPVAGLALTGSAKLPEGPIRHRHELMKEIGKNAKAVGDASKAGDMAAVAAAADNIVMKGDEVCALFPAGSTHAESRALPAIWEKKDDFDKLCADMKPKAAARARAAREGGDVRAAANTMFVNCKSCHDHFRKPEEEEGK